MLSAERSSLLSPAEYKYQDNVVESTYDVIMQSSLPSTSIAANINSYKLSYSAVELFSEKVAQAINNIMSKSTNSAVLSTDESKLRQNDVTTYVTGSKEGVNETYDDACAVTRSDGVLKMKARCRLETGSCKVCGDDATGMYFGALVCVPCKTFFLRYASEEFGFYCKYSKDCPVTVVTRTHCKYCRYQKCLQAGMSRKVRPTNVEASAGQQLCVVCHDVGNGIHFGAVTCEGCKKFFRRGMMEHETYTCRNEKSCIVNPRTRNACRYCRYQNCLAAGMSRAAIQMGRPSKMHPSAARRDGRGDQLKENRHDDLGVVKDSNENMSRPHPASEKQVPVRMYNLARKEPSFLGDSVIAKQATRRPTPILTSLVAVSGDEVFSEFNSSETYMPVNLSTDQHHQLHQYPAFGVEHHQQIFNPVSSSTTSAAVSVGGGNMSAMYNRIRLVQGHKRRSEEAWKDSQKVPTKLICLITETDDQQPENADDHWIKSEISDPDRNSIEDASPHVLSMEDNSGFLDYSNLPKSNFGNDCGGYIEHRSISLPRKDFVEDDEKKGALHRHPLQGSLANENEAPEMKPLYVETRPDVDVSSSSEAPICSPRISSSCSGVLSPIEFNQCVDETVSSSHRRTPMILPADLDIEALVGYSTMYWLGQTLPDENLMFGGIHWTIINRIVPAYTEFIQNSTKTNRSLKDEFINWKQQLSTEVSDSSAMTTKWIQNIVVPAFTVLSITFCKNLPGFSMFRPEDQVTILRYGQSASRILMATLNWYDPEKRTFRNFLTWRDTQSGGVDLFKQKLIDYGDDIAKLDLDPIEGALLNVLIIIAADYPDLIDKYTIEETRYKILSTFRAYTTAKFGTPNDRLETLFRRIPELRRLGFLHYRMTTTRTMTAEEVEESVN